MAPQTRSRVKAPANKVYTSRAIPKQQTFPTRRRALVTYGKRGKHQSPRQQTLTQIDYVSSFESEEVESHIDDTPIKKTAGSGRNVELDDTPGSSFHTQTLTQFLGHRGRIGDGFDEDVNALQVGDSEDDEEPLLSEEEAGLETDLGAAPEADKEQSPERGNKRRRAPSAVPETPISKRTRVEVPSSQSPISTPGQSVSKASPLKNVSTNIMPPKSALHKNPRPPTLVIRDSFSQGSSLMSTMRPSPTKQTPVKKARFASPIPDSESDDEFLDLGTPIHTDPSPAVAANPSEPPPPAHDQREIPDSDAESDLLDDEEEPDEDEAIKDIGAETQAAFDLILSSEQADSQVEPSSHPKAASTAAPSPERPRAPRDSTPRRHATGPRKTVRIADSPAEAASTAASSSGSRTPRAAMAPPPVSSAARSGRGTPHRQPNPGRQQQQQHAASASQATTASEASEPSQRASMGASAASRPLGTSGPPPVAAIALFPSTGGRSSRPQRPQRRPPMPPPLAPPPPSSSLPQHADEGDETDSGGFGTLPDLLLSEAGGAVVDGGVEGEDDDEGADLTTSQELPHSLMVSQVRRPPVVLDSEDEDGFDDE